MSDLQSTAWSAQTDPLCSFCLKGASDVRMLIVSPRAVICDECVAACASLVAERLAERVAADTLST